MQIMLSQIMKLILMNSITTIKMITITILIQAIMMMAQTQINSFLATGKTGMIQLTQEWEQIVT